MDVPNISPTAMGATQAPQPAPPPAEADGRAVADVAASKTDATPEVPLPVPSNAVQSGLVSAAALKETDTSPKLDASGTSAAERTLKPYGVTMLPQTGFESALLEPEPEQPAPDPEPSEK